MQHSKRSVSNPNVENDPVKILIGLLKLLMASNASSKTIIDYIEHYKIDKDTYLPSLDGITQIPLIYYCCSNTALSDLFLYLIEKKVNLNVQIIAENPVQQIELLYYSQTQYIQLLIENGCRLDPTKIAESVEKLLIKGNITKLIALYKHGGIKKDQLSYVLQKKGMIFKVLDQLYEKVYLISQKINNSDKFNEVYEDLIKNYINTFKFFFKNGVSVNQIDNGESFVQKVLNTYFISLIKFVLDSHPNLDSEELLHYSNFGLLNRQVMKFIYNDHNYEVIENYIKDKLVPKKINVKKNVTKRTIHY